MKKTSDLLDALKAFAGRIDDLGLILESVVGCAKRLLRKADRVRACLALLETGLLGEPAEVLRYAISMDVQEMRRPLLEQGLRVLRLLPDQVQDASCAASSQWHVR